MPELNIFMPDMYERGFSPFCYKSQFDLWGMACLYQGICMYNNDLKLSNRLAENVIQTETYTDVKIRQLTWHDGMPITADDFKYSFEICYAPRGGIPNRAIYHIEGAQSFFNGKSSHISGIKILDERTFRIYHNASDIYIKSLLTLPIVPKHCYGQTGEKNIGCGSYILKSLDRKNAYFIRNEGFCLGIPRIEKLNLMGGTISEQSTYLQNGSIDLTVIDVEDLGMLPASIFQKYHVFSLPQPASTVLKINPGSKLFYDKNARKRVSQKISRSALVHHLFHNYADPLLQFYPLVVAQQLNCVLIYPDVAPVESNLRELRIGVFNESREHKRVAELIAEMLKSDMQVSVCCYSSRSEAYLDGADLYVENMSHSLTPWSNSFVLQNSEEFSKSPDYSRIVELNQRLYLPSYLENISAFATECASILPVIPLYSKHEIQIVSKRIRHLKPDTRGAFWNIHEIDFS